MAYSDKVLDHYNNPRNVGSDGQDQPQRRYRHGRRSRMRRRDETAGQSRIPPTGIIEDAKFKTFGCGSAIASSSLATEMLKGKTVDEALEIKNTVIVNELSFRRSRSTARCWPKTRSKRQSLITRTRSSSSEKSETDNA